MASILKTLRLIADPTRLRILSLLRQEDLSVVELQEILAMGQSRISSQLSQLKQAGLVSDRRAGKNIIYAFSDPSAKNGGARLLEMLDIASGDVPEIVADRAALKLALRKRKDRARAYFDQLAGKFGRTYCPGRSWKALAETLLKLMPPLVIADLGAGEGTFSQLLAQRAEKVIAIDNSEKMVEYGARIARENGFKNLEYRLGDIEEPPIDDASVDLAFFSQALHHAEKPRLAVASAFRILKPGGKIVILDLLKHGFEDARELYADVWFGFSEVEIDQALRTAGFSDIDLAVVDREPESPHFQTLMAIGTKPA
ncbi:MAG: metalloregulator ArsR/SmtB family transcription factor [Verrucomicrobiae bacterium]|nr:metalloregulator ArsR/SmtB family transcription factor [Verrucomicrobiae bacterium]MCP5539279.1 metalloregulator ArsR/SmtB family transcription factor [Akkermansiaceae bacterium]